MFYSFFLHMKGLKCEIRKSNMNKTQKSDKQRIYIFIISNIKLEECVKEHSNSSTCCNYLKISTRERYKLVPAHFRHTKTSHIQMTNSLR